MAGGIRVLYVDDEPGLLEIARLFLEETGEFAVTTATSAQEALDSPSFLSHDIIIADYQMPRMDGIAFLKAVRQRTAGIPFILFTGRGREEVVIEAINNGADSYLQKGGDPEAQFAELAHRIHQAVDRRRAEHGRTESEKRLLDIINFLPDATFAIDRSGSVIAWNRAMEEMTGRPAAEMLLKGDHEYAIPFYGARRPLLIDLVFFPQDVVREKYSFVREDGEGLTAETTGATPKGTSCILWGRAAPLINSGGKIYGAIESIRDVTEAKEAEERLHRSEEKFRGMAERTSDLILIIDKGLRVSYVSPSSESIVGYDPEELAGKTPEFAAATVFSPCIPEFMTAVQECMKGMQVEQGGMQIKKKDGTIAFVDMTAIPVIHDGVFSGAQVSLRDVTGRKKAEMALKESEEKFRSIFDNSPYPIAINSHPGNRFLAINRAFLDVSGYTEAEVLGKNPVELGLLSLAEAAKLISNRLLTGKIENVPLALTAKDGKRVHVLFSTLPVTFGNKPATVTVTAEVTKLKRVEEDLILKNEDLHTAWEQLAASEEELRQNYDELQKKEVVLRESEEKFRALVEMSLDGILITDVSGTILFLNRAAARIVGVEDYEAVAGKRNVMEFVAPESQADVLRDFANVAQGTDTYLASYKLITDTKQEIWVESIGKRVPFENTMAALVSLRDVTGRKLAEIAVRESEKKFATVFRTSPVALTLVSVPDGKFVDANDTFTGRTGYSRAEIIGRTSEDLGLFADREEYGRFLSTLRDKQAVDGMELTCRMKTAGIRTCWFSSRIIMMNGSPHILSSVEDVTERRNAEKALRQANRKLGLLSGITRHDIRNQLLALNGFVSYLHKEIPGPKCEHLFSRITAASTKIANLIQFTREYEQLGQNVPVWQDVEKTAKMAAVDLLPDRVRLIADTDNYEVFADPMFMLVVYNLMDNSLRHGEHVTELAIRFSANEKSGTLVIEDNGAGIPADKKEQIFERGFGKNTGLGLFLIREILAITGVSITETGTEGAGARFEIHLPPGTWRRGPDRAGTMTSLHPVAGTGAEPPRGMPENPGAWTGERNV